MGTQSNRKWGRKITLVLPSGQEVVAHRLSLMTLISRGLIPDHLTAIASSIVNGAQVEQGADFMKRVAEFTDYAVIQCVLDPKIYDDLTSVEPPDPDAVPLSEIPDTDKGILFHFCMGMPVPKGVIREGEDIPDLTSFRGKSEGGDAGDSGARLAPEAVGSAGDLSGGDGNSPGL